MNDRAERYRAESHEQTAEQKAAINNRGDRPLPFFTPADLHGDFRPVPYIIKRLLDPGDWLTVFGDSGTLKSFFVIDMLMHVASGLDYCGHRVRRTAVLMVVGEGTEGIKKRVKAWLIRHGVKADDEQPHIVVTTRPAALMSDPHTIADTIKAAEAAIGVPIGIVVIDTLSSNFGSGDESSSTDVRTVMGNLRMVVGARAVIAVHHVGHAEKGRERGSYALRGDADRRAKVELAPGGEITVVSCEKSKDDLPFAPMSFKWRVVELGWLDPDGEMLTSLVLEPTQYEAPPKVEREPQGRLQRTVLDMVRSLGNGCLRADVIAALERLGEDRRNVSRALSDLVQKGKLDDFKGVISLKAH
jgi:hypothetical protein